MPAHISLEYWSTRIAITLFEHSIGRGIEKVEGGGTLHLIDTCAHALPLMRNKGAKEISFNCSPLSAEFLKEFFFFLKLGGISLFSLLSKCSLLELKTFSWNKLKTLLFVLYSS